MNFDLKYYQRIKIIDKVQFDKCVIIGSDLLNSIYEESRKEQIRVYSTGNKFLHEMLYTNTFNIVIDLIFRMLYKIGNLKTFFKKNHGVKNIIFINNVKNEDINEDEVKVFDIERKEFISKRFEMRMLIYNFKNICGWLKDGEDERFDDIERYFVSKYPEYYDFIVSERLKFFELNPIPENEENKQIQRNKHDEFVRRVISIQTTMMPQIKNACFSFVIHNLNNSKIMKILPCDDEVERNLLFSLYPEERVLFVSKFGVKRKNLFFWWKNELYYPMLCKSYDLFVGMNKTFDEIIKSILVKRKRERINTWLKLLTECEKSCGIGVFDTNASYRYTLFENINNLISKNIVNIVYPSYIEDFEINWIDKNEYIEQLPNWIGQFNSFSKIKVVNI